MDNLSDFVKKASVRKISDAKNFNYEVDVSECGCEIKGTLSVTATTDWEALELAWAYIVGMKEDITRRN